VTLGTRKLSKGRERWESGCEGSGRICSSRVRRTILAGKGIPICRRSARRDLILPGWVAAFNTVSAASFSSCFWTFFLLSLVEHFLSLPLQFPQGHSLLGRPIAAISRKDCSSNLVTLLLFPCFCLLPQFFQPGSHQNHPALSFQRIYIFWFKVMWFSSCHVAIFICS